MIMYVPTSVIFQVVDKSSHCDPKYEPLIASFDHPSSPPAAPAVFSKEWFSKAKPPKPMLPPILQHGFPLNLVTKHVQNNNSLKELT